MQTSKTSHYDVLIVGAGINGCCAAYFLKQFGLQVALADQTGIASGGSGAAGAFISPKISKDGPLKAVMEKAHPFAMEFYTHNFPDCTLRRPLLHIAKTSDDAVKLQAYKSNTTLKTETPPEWLTQSVSAEINDSTSIYFTEGAVVNAQKICHELSSGVDFFHKQVLSPVFEDNVWKIGNLTAKHLVLSTGAYPKVISTPYLSLRGIWGHRIDIQTSNPLSSIIHHYVSISPTSVEGIMAIGATHDVHYSPLLSEKPYDYEQGRAELLDKASKTLKLDNINVLRDYVGLRSGSNDYMPILGPLVDADSTLQMHPGIRNGEKIDPLNYHYYPNLTIINGSGGYGFVLAPYLSRQLADYLSHKKNIDEELLPVRFFQRWAKKLQS